MRRKKNIVDISLKPLWLILLIILVSSIFYTIVQFSLGNISCNIGYLPGTQGEITLDNKISKRMEKNTSNIKNILMKTQKTLRSSHMKGQELENHIHDSLKDVDFLVHGYFLENNKMNIFYTNHYNLDCTLKNIYCENLMNPSPTNKKQYIERNTQIKRIASSGGGWYASYWKRVNHKMEILYTYIIPVEDKNIILTASFIDHN